MKNIIDLYISSLNKLPVLVLVVLAALSVIVGDYAAKTWSVTQSGFYLFLAFTAYFLSAFFYTPSLLREGLIINSVLWGLISTIGLLVIGLLVFREQLSWVQLVAVILGTISVLILTIWG